MTRSFGFCVNCKQEFTGALQLQLLRRFWRRHRDESDEDFVPSCGRLGTLLGMNDEKDAENRLFDALSNSYSSCFSEGRLKLKAAERMRRSGQKKH